MTRRLLLAFPFAAGAYVVALHARVVAARPDAAWLLAALPILALVRGPRTRGTVAIAVVELGLLVPLHGFVTLLRAARLDGG